MSEDLTPGAGIYLDYNASAPLRPEARDAMLGWLEVGRAGNPHSVHRAGSAAGAAVERARLQVARLLGCSPGEVVFTSGATEANNLAIHAALEALDEGAALVTSAVEHPSVLAAAHAHARDGVPVSVVGVDGQGRLDVVGYREAVDAAADRHPPLVSVMAANNETGVLTDLEPVVDKSRSVGGFVHTDATQLVGRLPVDVRALGVDMLSLSAHKFGGPQGVGALYINRRARIPVNPLQYGGDQESGWRPGTLNVAGIAGLGAAAEAAHRDRVDESDRVAKLRDDLESRLRAALPGVWINGATAARLPGVASVTFPGLPAEALIAAMPELAVSEGSACAAGAPEPSHVLLAMGLERADAEATVRFSLGHATSLGEVEQAVTAVLRAEHAVADALAVTSPAHRRAQVPATGPHHDDEGSVGARV